MKIIFLHEVKSGGICRKMVKEDELLLHSLTLLDIQAHCYLKEFLWVNNILCLCMVYMHDILCLCKVYIPYISTIYHACIPYISTIYYLPTKILSDSNVLVYLEVWENVIAIHLLLPSSYISHQILPHEGRLFSITLFQRFMSIWVFIPLFMSI